MVRYSTFSLDQWLEHIQNQHWRTIDLKLDRISTVWRRLGTSTAPFVITIAGTNGKGSSVAMLESVLRTAGLRTGSYTSPHLVRYNERICIDGVQAADAEIVAAFRQIESAREEIPLTYFEYSTLCALQVFASRGAQVWILETGMGGRLDAVNMIDNDVALVTSIGLDHQQWLGDNREKIGREKAGIFRREGLAVCADPAPPASIARAAREAGTRLLQVGKDFSLRPDREFGVYHFQCHHSSMPAEWHEVRNIPPPLSGIHQLRNLSGVVAVLGLTSVKTGVTSDHLVQGLGQARVPARCEVISRRPLTILDVAHNADSAAELGEFLAKHRTGGKTIAVVGMLEDKDTAQIITPLMDEIDLWYLATLESDRGQTASDLGQQIRPLLLSGGIREFDSPRLAFAAARRECDPADRIVAFGSFYTVGDILQATGQEAPSSGPPGNHG